MIEPLLNAGHNNIGILSPDYAYALKCILAQNGFNRQLVRSDNYKAKPAVDKTATCGFILKNRFL